MFFTKDHKTENMFDPWSYLGPKRKKLLEKSWAKLFQKEILPDLPVEKLAPYFHIGFGRPTKELYAALGVLILQQMNDLSDNETVNQMAFNLQWHYALNITDESDASKYLAPKTLWNFRYIISEKGLDKVLFDHTTEKLARVFKVDTDKQRIDSVHIRSNMRRLGRISIFSRSIHSFLINLKRHHKELFETLSKELVEKYTKKEAIACFSMVKPSESEKTLSSLSNDLFRLIECFKGNKEVENMHTYKLLLRVFKEQCNVKESKESDTVEVSVKPPKGVPSDSLQNPSDPDAGYNAHKGQGYHVQIMETYNTNKENNEDSTSKDAKKALNLITHVEVKPANKSDAKALVPAVESTKERGLAPKEVLADSLYGSDENHQEAKAQGVELISPVMGSEKEDKISLSDFDISETGKITKCPEGQVPIKTKTKTKKENERHVATFNSGICSSCSKVTQCPVREGKKNYYLRYSNKQLRISERRKRELEPEFKERYRYRSGVEAAMSQYDRLTGVKHLRVRGLKAVRFSAILKAIGINIFRAATLRKADMYDKKVPNGQTSAFGYICYIIKEQLKKVSSLIFLVPNDIAPCHGPEQRLAA